MREIVIDAARPARALNLQELWDSRELLLVFVKRDVAVRYQQTALGILWAVLQPAGLVLIFTVIFGRLGRLSEDVSVPYPLFALAGLLPWMFFASALTSASQSLLAARGLISKVYFPRLLVPASAIGAPLVDFGFATLIMLALMFHYGMPLGPSMLALPMLTALTALLAVALGTFFSALVVMYRDARHLVPFLVTGWLFVTPVIYPPAMLGEAGLWWLYVNPMAGIVDGMRSAWFSQEFHWDIIGAAAAWTLVALFFSVRYFRTVERNFVDVI